jgi:thymidylate synthase (FAD)
MKVTIGNGGFVERLEVFGSDLTVVNAARVSFDKESLVMDPRDERLVSYLAKHGHNSPFFHPQVRFRIRMPIFVAREWFRHTVGFARNEVSRRYVDDEPENWIPTVLRARDANKKQGSKEEPIANNSERVEQIQKYMKETVTFYNLLLADGVAPEIARAILPQAMYTEFIETASLAAYARLCGLRLDPHAQAEIREFAGAVSAAMSEAFPVSWRALMGTEAVPAAVAAAIPLTVTTEVMTNVKTAASPSEFFTTDFTAPTAPSVPTAHTPDT